MSEYRALVDKSTKRVRGLMDKVKGVCRTQCKGPNDTVLEFWQIKSRMVIVQYWPEGGVTHYTESSTNTWDDMEKELASL